MSNGDTPKVLMIAYACNPEGGGEHWLGWRWAEEASKKYSVHLITTPNARAQVEKHATSHGIIPYFVEQPRGGRWGRKIRWQSRVLKFASELHTRKHFRIVHQTTFHTFRVPFLAADLGIPSVWGPVAGGEAVPAGFGGYLGPARFGETMRKLVNQLCLRLPAISRSMNRSSVIFVSNQTTLNFLPPNVRHKCLVVSPNALRPEDEMPMPSVARTPDQSSGLRLLYVGNCAHTRAMRIVFEAMTRGGLEKCRLTVAGTGEALNHWKQCASHLGLGKRVHFTGFVTRDKLPELYGTADVLVFPALRDSGGSALLEAMSKAIPVICLDWGGPGEMVNEQSGVKIPVSTPAKTVAAFAEGLRQLEQDSGWRRELCVGARLRACSHFTWANKRRLLEDTYDRLLSSS